MSGRTEAQREASRRNGAKSHGPITAAGKTTSSLNALKHGFSAKDRVLPHESVEHYEAVQQSWVEALNPNTVAEVRLVARVADADWRLQRVSRVAQAALLARLEQALASSTVAKLATRVENVRDAVQALALTTASTTVGTSPTALAALLPSLRVVATAVEELQLPSASSVALVAAIRDLVLAEVLGDAEDAWKKLGTIASELERDLSAKAAELAQQVERQRQEILEAQAVVGDSELKRLDRQRQVIQREMDQVLGTLRVMKELAPARSTASIGCE